MRRFALGLALAACLPIFAQDQPAAPGHNFSVFRIRDGFRVVSDNGRVLEATAKDMESLKPSGVLRFRGKVEIALDGVELRADEVDYHWDTGELEPYGNVQLQPR